MGTCCFSLTITPAGIVLGWRGGKRPDYGLGSVCRTVPHQSLSISEAYGDTQGTRARARDLGPQVPCSRGVLCTHGGTRFVLCTRIHRVWNVPSSGRNRFPPSINKTRATGARCCIHSSMPPLILRSASWIFPFDAMKYRSFEFQSVPSKSVIRPPASSTRRLPAA